MSKKKVQPMVPNSKTQKENVDVILSKLTTDKKERNVATTNIPEIKNSIMEKVKNNENITKLFPDIELSIQILTSNIISPNDMTGTGLIYAPPEIKVPMDVKNVVMDTIKKYIKKHYSLEDKLPTIIREALFTKGAYIEAVIPEAIVDDVINMTPNTKLSIESIIDSMSDNNTFLSNEEINIDFNIKDKSITLSEEDLGITMLDNYSAITLPDKHYEIISKLNRQKIFGNDSIISNEDFALYDEAFREKSDGEVPYIEITDTGKKSIGKPMVMKLPVESTIPIHIINDPSKHIGYLVLLNEQGGIINIESSLKDATDDEIKISQRDSKLNIIKKAEQALHGLSKDDKKLYNLEGMYTAIVDKMIKEKIANGMYGDAVEIKDNYEVYQVMFNRALKNKKTKLLFLPADLVQYYAFEYRDNGTGKSMMEKVNILFSIRAVLLFSRLMANLKNSVSTTVVNATLDEHDPDPEATMEKIISESLKTRQTQLPLGVTKVNDLVDWIHKVGFRYNFKHPDLPDMELDVSTDSTDKVVPDDELDEKIQEDIIMSFGLTVDLVKSGYDPEFATTVVSRNILLARRISQLQNTLTPLLTSHVRKFLYSDANLRDEIEKVLKDNVSGIRKLMRKTLKDDGLEALLKNDDKLVKYVLKKFIDETNVKLPRPEVTEDNNLDDSFDKLNDRIDKYLELILSTDALPDELIGDASDKIESLRGVVKAMLIKRWMADNNFMPELSEFFSYDDEGKPMFDIQEEYKQFAEGITKALIPLLKMTKKISNETDEKLDKIENEEDDDNYDDYESDEEVGGMSDDELESDEDDIDEDSNDTAETKDDDVNYDLEGDTDV